MPNPNESRRTNHHEDDHTPARDPKGTYEQNEEPWKVLEAIRSELDGGGGFARSNQHRNVGCGRAGAGDVHLVHRALEPQKLCVYNAFPLLRWLVPRTRITKTQLGAHKAICKRGRGGSPNMPAIENIGAKSLASDTGNRGTDADIFSERADRREEKCQHYYNC